MASSADDPNARGRGVSETPGRGRLFAWVFAALCGLTAASVAVAWTDSLSPAQQGLAIMGVALLKATLVLMFFMHLMWERAWKYVLTFPAVLLGVALMLSLFPDIGFRGEHYSESRRQAGPRISEDSEAADSSR